MPSDDIPVLTQLRLETYAAVEAFIAELQVSAAEMCLDCSLGRKIFFSPMAHRYFHVQALSNECAAPAEQAQIAACKAFLEEVRRTSPPKRFLRRPGTRNGQGKGFTGKRLSAELAVSADKSAIGHEVKRP